MESMPFCAEWNSGGCNYIIAALRFLTVQVVYTRSWNLELCTLELTGAIVGQTVLLVAAWSFLGAILAADPLTVSDSLANFIHSKPTETTWIVTLRLLATAFSVVTTKYAFIEFGGSFRHNSLRYPVFCPSLSRKHCDIECTNLSRSSTSVAASPWPGAHS